jgi:GT2 family glycosyltransferase
MPGSPDIADRTWFGIARCRDGGIAIEGAVETWSGRHDHAQILIVDERGPVDWLLLGPEDAGEECVARHLSELPGTDDRPDLPELPAGDLTVAICTRERPSFLRACLERVRAAVNDHYEVLVIDNAPRTDATERIVELFSDRGMRIRRVVEPRPGLSRARNRALASAETRYVAFTDDDALADSEWPLALHRGFSTGESVAVVTGIVPPAQIETKAQALFEKKLKWSNNLTPETFAMARQHSYPWVFPYSAGNLGTGANFAVDRKVVLELGGFDEALGAGTRTMGGEDMEMFVRVLRADYELSFQPSAIVWHMHISDPRALRRILFGYGKGLSAIACSEFRHPGKLAMLRGTVRGARNLTHDRQAELEYGMPWTHIALELAGLVCGPFAYASERWRSRPDS